MTEQELNRVREFNSKIREIEIHLTTLRNRADDITPKFDGLPHASTIRSQVENLALKIVEESLQLDELHARIVSEAANLTKEICRLVADPQERTVMILRYVSCMRFRDISFRMNFSDRKVFTLHHDALKNLQLPCS